MGQYSIGEAINLLLERSRWKPKVTELRMRQEWEEIVGKTISRYTRNLMLNDTTLTIYSDVAALKQAATYRAYQRSLQRTYCYRHRRQITIL